jgi:hypothetical protein
MCDVKEILKRERERERERERGWRYIYLDNLLL